MICKGVLNSREPSKHNNTARCPEVLGKIRWNFREKDSGEYDETHIGQLEH
jgi:hypothetical protein